MDSSELEQRIDELLDANGMSKEHTFSRFRGELLVLERAYEEDGDNLTDEQVKRLSKLEKKLGCYRFIVAGTLLTLSTGLGLACYNSMPDSGISLNSVFFGIESFLLGLGAPIWTYLGLQPYKKGIEVLNSLN